MKRYIQFVLHSHLPFVLSHGRWPHGADWIFEAAAETYIPLLQILRRAEVKNIPVKFTIGISPVLAEQLRHHTFPDEFMSYIGVKLDAAQEDQRYFMEIGDESRVRLARMWEDYYATVAHNFQECGGDIVGEFSRYQGKGFIEIITCAATHGYLPLLGTDNSVFAQLAIAKNSYKEHFGTEPKGIWLPEAAYRPRYEWAPPVGKKQKPVLRKGIEEFLYHLDIKFFFVDSHLLKGGKAIGVYIDRFEALKKLWAQFEKKYRPAEELPRSLYRPFFCSSGGGKSATSFFVRDPKTALQVWSGEWGYPGNPAYLDFHKKHFPGGHRYWRVVNAKADLAEKELYVPEWVEGALNEQAEHFVALCDELLENNSGELKSPPILTAPFDAELFGHWWFEGPRWLLKVAEKIAKHENLQMTTGWDYLEKYPPTDVVQLPEGSWGEGGFHYIWLNDWTSWTWEHIYRAEETMRRLANKFEQNKDNMALRKVLSQLGRELLLLESSDWQFLISTWSARDYAEQRVAFHREKFDVLASMAEEILNGQESSTGRWRELELIEIQDDIFRNLDPSLWADSRLNFD